MRPIVAAVLAFWHLTCVGNCARLPKEPLDLHTPPFHDFAGVVQPNPVPPLDANSPRTKRTPFWKWSKALLVGMAQFSGSVRRGHDLWRVPRLSKVRAPASSLRGDSRGPRALAFERPGSPTSRPHDGLRARDRRQGRSLPTALALRGGFEVLLEDPELEAAEPPSRNLPRAPGPSEHPSENVARAEPPGSWFSDEVSLEKAQAVLVNKAWMVDIEPHQTMWFEFVLRRGRLCVDITYHDPPDRAFELVELSPVLVSGRFLGFTCSNWLFQFRFSHIGKRLRVDIQYPSSFWDGEDQLTLMADPVPRRGPSATYDSGSTKPMQQKVIRNIESRRPKEGTGMVPPDVVAALERHQELAQLLRRPGHWTGHASPLRDWDFRFHDDVYGEPCITGGIALKHKFTPIVDVVRLCPLADGSLVSAPGRLPSYRITADAGRLQAEILYTHGTEAERHNVLLDYEPPLEDFAEGDGRPITSQSSYHVGRVSVEGD